jgi:hypothetical protein
MALLLTTYPSLFSPGRGSSTGHVLSHVREGAAPRTSVMRYAARKNTTSWCIYRSVYAHNTSEPGGTAFTSCRVTLWDRRVLFLGAGLSGVSALFRALPRSYAVGTPWPVWTAA